MTGNRVSNIAAGAGGPYQLHEATPGERRAFAAEFLWRITGPFIDTMLEGTCERCGHAHVNALNLAYRAGQRNPL